MTATTAPAYSTAETAPDRVTGLHDFFHQLYGDDAPGYLTICSAPAGQKSGNLRTLWFHAGTELRAAAEAAIDLADQRRNVWFGVGLRREPKDGRGEAADVIAIPGVWSDIDIAHAVHKKDCLPKSEAEALELDNCIRLASSLIVQTGHGIQSHRIFREPWILNSDEDRAEAQALLNRFKATMNRLAGAKKYKLDAVHDLARLLRPPFTVNWKEPAAPVPVKILSREDYLVYEPSDFDEHLDPAPTKESSKPAAKPAPTEPRQNQSKCNEEPSFHDVLAKARTAKNGDKFSRLENGSDAEHGGDTSAADQAFANLLAFWFGRDYVSMDAAFRQSRRMRPKWDEKHYADGTTYGTATLNKAIADCREVYEPKAKQDDALADFPLSDAGNGERMMHRHGDQLKFIARWSRPIIHVGTHWEVDETGAVDRLALETMRDLKRKGARLAESDDEDKHEIGVKLLKYAHACESRKKLRDMIAQAATVQGATIKPDDLDADPWLFNTPNGTLVLNEGASPAPQSGLHHEDLPRRL